MIAQGIADLDPAEPEAAAPVRDPYPDSRHHEPIMVDLDELNLKLALAMTRRQANGDKDR